MVNKTMVFVCVMFALVTLTLAGPKPWPVANPTFFKDKKCNCGYMAYGGGGYGGGGGGYGMGGGGYGGGGGGGGGGGYGRR